MVKMKDSIIWWSLICQLASVFQSSERILPTFGLPSRLNILTVEIHNGKERSEKDNNELQMLQMSDKLT
jgi:hypothetical protein